MKQIFNIIISFLFTSIIAVSCNQYVVEKEINPKINSHETIVVTDSRGQYITFEEPPTKIISLSPAHTEIIYALGLENHLVGTDTFSDFPQKAKNKPKVGDAFNINLEAIVNLEPDLVYTTFETPVAPLENAGIKVLYLFAPKDIEDLIANIKLLGAITDSSDKAQDLTTAMESRINLIRSKLSDVKPSTRIYYELDPGFYTAGPNSFIGDIFSLLKTHNIADGTENPYPKLSEEVIINEDPTIIILGDSIEYLPNGVTIEDVKSRPSWGNITAITTDKVYPFDDSLISRPGPRIVEGIEQLGHLIYPALVPEGIR